MEENLNKTEQGTQDNGGNEHQDGALMRTFKAVRRGYIRFRKTKTGKVVVSGSKAALMGLGLWKLGEIVSGDKKKEEVTVVLSAPVQPEQEEPVKEPAAEEANETVEEAVQE